MNEPRVIESVTNECQSLGRAHESSSARAEQLIACLEGEIAKRDARIVELQRAEKNDAIAYKAVLERQDELRAELAALKAQEPVAYISGCYRDVIGGKSDRTPLGAELAFVNMGWIGQIPLYAAPVSEAKAQGEYGDAYQGAREDLAIWKRRALEAEEKVLQQEQIIDHLTSEAQGESRFGEPVVTPDAPCVPDGYVLADKKALGTVLQALVNAPHHIRELQVTRQPVELFSDNPINVLIANYEAPAAPVQQPKCRTCDDNGLIGGPSFYSPDEGGDPCPDCCAPVQQVSVPECFTKLLHHAHGMTFGADWNKGTMAGYHREPLGKAVVQCQAWLAAAPAAPAADAGLVDMYRHLQKVTPYRFKKIQDASITDGGDVMYFHKDRFDAALLADMAAHCAAKGVV